MKKFRKAMLRVLKRPWLLGVLIRNQIFYLFTDYLLNRGERFDPKLLKKFSLSDTSSLERYNFAKKLLDRDDEVLDIACGTGYGSQILADNCRQVTGVDRHLRSIEFANKNYKNKRINYLNSEFSANTLRADVVVSLETIEHLEQALMESVKKLVSWARKKVIISVPYGEDADHNRHHQHANIRENNFDGIENLGRVNFFYQNQEGQISQLKTEPIQTLILLIELNQ